MDAKLLLQIATLLLLLPAARLVAAEPDSPGKPTEFVIGLSPYLDTPVKDDVYRRIVGFLLEEMPLDSTLSLYDAHRLRTITEVEVPKTRAFQSGRTRANQFKEPIRKLRDFLAVTNQPPSSPVPAPAGAVRLPQFLDFIAARAGRTNHAVVVMILGNPLYADAKEPGFSMVDGYFPTDGHLAASREETVYGLKERRGVLGGVVVHVGYFGDPWVSDVHEQKIHRFWALYLQGQGGRLGAFTGDLASLFRAARSAGDARPERFEADPADTKIAMVRVTRDLGKSDWITRDSPPPAPTGPPGKTFGPMKIGIRWKGDIDLDLYAKPRADAETLFFQHPRSAEGYYFKDHRSSPDREYEFIEFESPVNVWDLEARVNFYEGEQPGGPAGEVRVEFEGRIYSGSFTIGAEHGNQGRSGAKHHRWWATIDVPQILKLRSAPAAALQQP